MKIFKEEQRFTQSWLIIIIIISTLIPVGIGVYGIIAQIILKKPFGDKPMTDFGLIVFTLSMILISGFIFIFKLTTRIDEKGIHYQFFPFHFKLNLISWNEILKAYVRNYDPIGEYGGWGLKGGWSKSKGKAINVSGNVGIQLELKTGKKLLIGTNKKEEAKRVLETYQSKIY